MRTSDIQPAPAIDAAPARPAPKPAIAVIPLRTVALEAAAGSTLAIATAALLAPHDVGLASLSPHPVWLAVALLAARYGTRGVGVGLLFGWGLAGLVALMLRLPPALLAARASSGPDLGALLVTILIGWVASIHEKRCADLAATVGTLRERCVADRDAVVALRTAAVALRARADRLDTSLTFLRDVSTRLEGDDPVAAAQAALELAAARIGARAGLVVAIDGNAGTGDGAEPDGGRPETLASFGAWSSFDLGEDCTVGAALRNRRATRAIDLGDAGSTDSDLAAPILAPAAVGGGGDSGHAAAPSGHPILGLIILRGVPQGGASAAALHDLALVAAWCTRSLARARAGARPERLIEGLRAADGDPDAAAARDATGATAAAPADRSMTRARSRARLNS